MRVIENDDIVTRALAREAELQRELTELRVFLSVYRKLVGVDEPSGVRGKPVTAIAASEDRGAALMEDAPPPPQGMRQTEFVPFVRAILLEHGRPMQQHEIRVEFKKKGRYVGGANENENLKSKLWRAREAIINIGGSGFWPIDVPCPAVSYVPPKADHPEGEGPVNSSPIA